MAFIPSEYSKIFLILSCIQIKNNAGIPNGKIFKQWNGCSGLHGNDKFYLEFPNGINEKTKALVIGATMLVVSLYLMWRKWIVSKNKYLKYLHSWIYDTNEKCII